MRLMKPTTPMRPMEPMRQMGPMRLIEPNIMSSKPSPDFACFWQTELKPVSAISDSPDPLTRKRGLELKSYQDEDYRPKRVFAGPNCTSGTVVRTGGREKITFVAADKDEAAKSMGYEELPLMEELAQRGQMITVGNIPSMRAPIAVNTTGTLSHGCFWPARILGFISPAATEHAKAVRAQSRWRLLVGRSTRMVRLGLDFSSWPVGQLRKSWVKESRVTGMLNGSLHRLLMLRLVCTKMQLFSLGLRERPKTPVLWRVPARDPSYTR